MVNLEINRVNASFYRRALELDIRLHDHFVYLLSEDLHYRFKHTVTEGFKTNLRHWDRKLAKTDRDVDDNQFECDKEQQMGLNRYVTTHLEKHRLHHRLCTEQGFSEHNHGRRHSRCGENNDKYQAARCLC